jgi:transcription termination/antitermination protein NusA
MDIKNFMSAISQIAEEKGITKEKVLETIEMAIAAAYKKDYGKKGQIIKAKLDPESGEVEFWQVKLAVDEKMIYSEAELAEMEEKELKERNKAKEKPGKQAEESSSAEADENRKIRFNPERHIMVKEAKKIKPQIEVGQELEIPLESKIDYGRIAAQTAKQVILQRVREAEKESVLAEYKAKEGEIISGIVQRVEGRNIFMDIGKTLGILPKEEQVPREFYRPGQRLKVYLLKVEETPRGPVVVLSRAYPKLISKLFELEVPEISSGQVEIKSIAREAGSRSKISVSAEMEGVDPIGSMVGQKGTRVMAVINELGGEKIDIIEYSPEPEKYIANSLSPAKTLEVKIMPKNKAQVIVPEDQLSLAIGKDGQNVRLAAKLTGWKIDVKAPSRDEEEETAPLAEEDKGTEKTEEKKKKREVEEDKSSSSPSSRKRDSVKKSEVKKEAKTKKPAKKAEN